MGKFFWNLRLERERIRHAAAPLRERQLKQEMDELLYYIEEKEKLLEYCEHEEVKADYHRLVAEYNRLRQLYHEKR